MNLPNRNITKIVKQYILYVHFDVFIDWKKEEGSYCSDKNLGNTFPLSEAKLLCIQDDKCTGVSSSICKSSNDKRFESKSFELCSADFAHQIRFKACMYMKPGDMFYNCINIFSMGYYIRKTFSTYRYLYKELTFKKLTILARVLW